MSIEETLSQEFNNTDIWDDYRGYETPYLDLTFIFTSLFHRWYSRNSYIQPTAHGPVYLQGH